MVWEWRVVRPSAAEGPVPTVEVKGGDMANDRVPKWMRFEPCSHYEYDFATGEGERSCSYGDCANLPEDLDVFCEQCRFNYFTMEGNPGCEDPLTCEHAAVPSLTSRTIVTGQPLKVSGSPSGMRERDR